MHTSLKSELGVQLNLVSQREESHDSHQLRHQVEELPHRPVSDATVLTRSARFELVWPFFHLN